MLMTLLILPWTQYFHLLSYALSVLSRTAPGDQAPLVFALVFVIVWCGAAIVTLNAQLLGGTM